MRGLPQNIGRRLKGGVWPGQTRDAPFHGRLSVDAELAVLRLAPSLHGTTPRSPLRPPAPPPLSGPPSGPPPPCGPRCPARARAVSLAPRRASNYWPACMNPRTAERPARPPPNKEPRRASRRPRTSSPAHGAPPLSLGNMAALASRMTPMLTALSARGAARARVRAPGLGAGGDGGFDGAAGACHCSMGLSVNTPLVHAEAPGQAKT